jgi:hypothetical protein
MTPEEYRARVLAIEKEANAQVDAAIDRFPVVVRPSRSVRYRDIGRAIAAAGAQRTIDAIEADMREQLEALEREWWASQED